MICVENKSDIREEVCKTRQILNDSIDEFNCKLKALLFRINRDKKNNSK